MSRNATIDYARLLAAFGIIFFHAKAPGGSVGYAGLPFFTMLTVCLATQAAQSTAFTRFLAARAKRLLVPWLVWSGIYGSLKIAQAILEDHTIAQEFSGWMLLTGPAIHLWFLPFIFAVSVAVFPIGRRLKAPGLATALLLMVAVTGAATLSFWLLGATKPPIPLAQWLEVLPAAIWGIALAYVWGREKTMPVAGGTLLAIVLLAWTAGWTTDLFQFGLAGSAVLLCRLLPLRPTLLSGMAAQASLFIYLAHPLVMTLLHKMGGLPPNHVSSALLTCIVTFTLAICLDLAKRSHRPVFLRR